MRYNPSSLPEINKVEIINLRGVEVNSVDEYMQNSADAESVEIIDEAAQRIAVLWRGLPEYDQMRCHNPPFGLRFYVGEKCILQASICWHCNNIYGDTEGEHIHYQFDGESEIAQELLAVCKSYLPIMIIETERLYLREVTAEDDGEFVLELLNQPSFIENIGDRNVRTVEQAREYIEQRFRAGYRQFGFGMWAVELKETGAVIGICGFVKRDTLPDADIGFAFLPPFEGKGYALESAVGTMKYGADKLNFKRVLAITTQRNDRSGRLLEKLGFRYERLIDISDETLKLFVWNAA